MSSEVTPEINPLEDDASATTEGSSGGPDELEPAVQEILDRSKALGGTALAGPKRTRIASGANYQTSRWNSPDFSTRPSV